MATVLVSSVEAELAHEIKTASSARPARIRANSSCLTWVARVLFWATRNS
jgi:hypothetical protein